MRTKYVLILCVAAAAALFTACGAPAANNSNAKPANAANATNSSNTTSNSSTSSSNSSTSTTAAQDFTLINKTGVVIDKLYVSPANKDEWGDDILGQDQLADGQSV